MLDPLWAFGIYIALAAYLGVAGRSWAPAVYLASMVLFFIVFTVGGSSTMLKEMSPSVKEDPSGGLLLYLGATFTLFFERLLRAMAFAFILATFGTPMIFPKETIQTILVYLIPYALAPFAALYLLRPKYNESIISQS